MIEVHHAKFRVGQIIVHKLFNYRGIIFDVDPVFQGSEEWYRKVALSCPPKDEPWYKVLVHNALHDTYVAERNMIADGTNEPIFHPLIGNFFELRQDGVYVPIQRKN